MAPITPGEGGTIKANTAEGAVFQTMQWWQLQESNETVNPLDQQFFTGTKDTDTNLFEGKWKLPVTITSEGLLTATPVYQGLNFAAGTGGTISASSAEEYTLKLMLWLINRQKDTNTSNPDKIINITGSVNLNDGTIEGEFKIPFSPTLLPNGGIQDLAREYLA
ncbi:hypothetical protein QUA82_09885 [Microcoleus sp. F8-D3]